MTCRHFQDVGRERRRGRSRPFALCAALLISLASAGLTAMAGTLADTVEVIKNSVVGIGTMQYTRRPAGQFLGTGFAVGDGRHVITNAHVLPEETDSARGEFLAVFIAAGGRVEARRATLVALDRVHDLSVLLVEELELPALNLAPHELVREGETYAFTGYPLGTLVGMYPVTHRGIVASVTPIAITHPGSPNRMPSALRRRSSYKVYQLDATAYPGNSGSPLYDPRSGEVVGVVNKVLIKGTAEKALEQPSGITYAIPVMHVHRLLEVAMQGG